jgi:ATP/maltotriose-dependent transcriptional regulator MalT
MGSLLMREGRAEEAIASVRTAEAILREIADREELCKLLCVRGRIELVLGEAGRAREALAEAEALVQAMESTPDSETGREVAALRAAMT